MGHGMRSLMIACLTADNKKNHFPLVEGILFSARILATARSYLYQKVATLVQYSNLDPCQKSVPPLFYRVKPHINSFQCLMSHPDTTSRERQRATNTAHPPFNQMNVELQCTTFIQRDILSTKMLENKCIQD